MTDVEARAYDAIISRLDRMEEKMDRHIAESAPIHAELAVLKAEMRLIKFVAGGLGLALAGIVAETLWALLSTT